MNAGFKLIGQSGELIKLNKVNLKYLKGEGCKDDKIHG
jgi:hypothetical protein